MAKADIYWTCKSVYAVLQNFATGQHDGSEQEQHVLLPEFIARLWQIYRQGTATCHLFNLLKPETPIDIKNDNKKVLVYKFLLACRQYLNMRDDELFTVSELYQDDVNGLAKITYTTNKILCRLRDEGAVETYIELRPPSVAATILSVRDKVIRELLETERKYVQDLETLQEYARELQTALSLDTLHIIFGNLHALIDFQLRFLLLLEYYADKNDIDNLGRLFVDLEEAFSVYEPYCAHLPDALEAVLCWTPQLQAVSHTIEPTYELQSFLIKPVQRVCKYPLLVQQLVKNTSESSSSALTEGLTAIQRVASKVNETRRLQENQQMVKELKERVVDWRGIVDVDKQCGVLMLHDRVMVRHKSDTAKQVQAYLFEKMLLVCKDVPKKAKKKSLQAISLAGLINISNIAQVDVEGADEQEPQHMPCLRIFFTSSSKPSFDLESFTLEFLNCEQLRQWDSTLSKLIHQQRSSKKQPLTPLIIEPQAIDQEEPLSPTFLSYVSMNKLHLSTSSSSTSSSSTTTTTSSSYNSYPYTPSSPSFETPLPTPTSLSTTCSTPTTASSVGRRSRSQSSPNIVLAHEASAKDAIRRVVESDPLVSTVKVKLHCNEGIYVFFAPRNIFYDDLRALIERKLRLKRFGYIKYRDEDGDLITMHCDEDVSLAFDLKETRVLHLYITDL